MIKANQRVTFDKFSELYPKMLIELYKAIATEENTGYLKRMNIKSLKALTQDIQDMIH